MQKEIPDIHLVKQVVARFFSSVRELTVERVAEGVSTYVYRIHCADETFYLRILPEIGASFAPEAYIHQCLCDMQIKVPAVVHFEHFNETLECSLLLTTEIAGSHLGHCSRKQDLRPILIEAGRELAIINSLPVKGFGWVRRDGATFSPLTGELPTYRAFVFEYLEHDLAAVSSELLQKNEVIHIRRILHHFNTFFDDQPAWLAHGDFDVSHIYHQQGRYTGIIDFGEIRGAHTLYDLGHFRMHDGETLPFSLLPFLIEGYREITTLPPDYEQHIYLISLLIALRRLARQVEKGPESIKSDYARYCVRVIRRELQVFRELQP